MDTGGKWILGLTGGIASGKTAASDWLAAAGCAVVDADTESRAVTRPGGEAIPEIARAFGKNYILPDGSLDRAKMRALVFSSPDDRKKLEAIVHPLVRRRIEERLRAASGCYAVLVVPLLASILAWRPALARLLAVDLPESDQTERLRARSGLSEDEARAIIASQASRAERIAAADDVIVNCGTKEELFEALASLHEHYLALAQAQGPKARKEKP